MKRRTLAVLLDHLQGDYQTKLRLALEAAARARDLNLLTFVGRPLGHPDPYVAAQNAVYERLIGAPVDGLVLASAALGSASGGAVVREFSRRFAHRPRCSVSMEIPGVPSVVVDNHQGTRVLVDHIVEVHGCRRIAYIRGPENNSEANERFDAFVGALRAHGLEVDLRLVTSADFWVTQGASAALRLLDSGRDFDALIAANDHMALGALDALRSRGLNVPKDLLVAGFDDVPSALVAFPSLTTVRQPLELLGRVAIETVLMQIDNRPVPPVQRIPVELVTRQSCGCAYRLSEPSDFVGRELVAAVSGSASLLQQQKLSERMLECVTFSTDTLGLWADELLQALNAELSGASGQFLLALEAVLHRAQPYSDGITQFNNVIGVLRSAMRHERQADRAWQLDELWHSALLLIGAAVSRAQVRERFRIEDAYDALQNTVARISTALGYPALAGALAEALPAVGIRRAAVSLYATGDCGSLRALSVVHDVVHESPAIVFDSSLLAPPGFFASAESTSYIVLPITFGIEQLGLAVLQSGQHVAIYAMLREQIAAALKAAALHRAVVSDASAGERAEREHLEKELEIARQIQVGVLPVCTQVDGLELAGRMIPAADVGGDYYDILPTRDGCWLGIGDVAGHGLFAGLVMLMIQSMVHAMVRSETAYAPSEIFNAVNAALWDNVRNRLHQDHHASLALIRYERSGELSFAGCHDDMLICRARTGRCERIAFDGVWACAMPDVRSVTTNSQVALEGGDVLVLYTDGVIEAMNLQREQFGVQRLCALVERHRQLPPSMICEAVASAAQEWSSVQADDISVLVARYSGPAAPRMPELPVPAH